jgi:hypothetical protein
VINGDEEKRPDANCTEVSEDCRIGLNTVKSEQTCPCTDSPARERARRVDEVFDMCNDAVTIIGSATEGETLTADTSAIPEPIGDTPNAFVYQWIDVGNNEILDSTTSTYALTTDNVGKTNQTQSRASASTFAIPSSNERKQAD